MSNSQPTEPEPAQATMLDLTNMIAAALREGAPETISISIATNRTHVSIHANNAADAKQWVTYWKAHYAHGWREKHYSTSISSPYLRHEFIGTWRGRTIEVFHLTEPTVDEKRRLLQAQLAALDAEAVPA